MGKANNPWGEGMLTGPLNHVHLQWFGEGDSTDPAPAGDKGDDGGQPTGGDPPGTVDGKSSPGWRAALPADYRDSEYARQFAKPVDLYKRALELEEKAKNAIIKPGDGASEEEIRAYRASLGVPESKDLYAFEKPKDLPPGFKYDDTLEQWFRDLAHEAGVPGPMAAALFNGYNKRLVESYKALEGRVKEQQTKAVEELRGELGEKYDTEIKGVRRVVHKLFGEEFAKMLDQTGVGDFRTGDHPAFVRGMLKLKGLISEDSLETGEQVRGRTSSSDVPYSFKNTPGMQ